GLVGNQTVYRICRVPKELEGTVLEILQKLGVLVRIGLRRSNDDGGWLYGDAGQKVRGPGRRPDCPDEHRRQPEPQPILATKTPHPFFDLRAAELRHLKLSTVASMPVNGGSCVESRDSVSPRWNTAGRCLPDTGRMCAAAFALTRQCCSVSRLWRPAF